MTTNPEIRRKDVSDELGEAMDEILDEYDRAVMSHPPMNGAHEGYAVILEELDELWELVRRKQSTHREIKADLRKEACQVAAMGLRFMLDVCGELPPGVAQASFDVEIKARIAQAAKVAVHYRPKMSPDVACGARALALANTFNLENVTCEECVAAVKAKELEDCERGDEYTDTESLPDEEEGEDE